MPPGPYRAHAGRHTYSPECSRASSIDVRLDQTSSTTYGRSQAIQGIRTSQPPYEKIRDEFSRLGDPRVTIQFRHQTWRLNYNGVVTIMRKHALTANQLRSRLWTSDTARAAFVRLDTILGPGPRCGSSTMHIVFTQC